MHYVDIRCALSIRIMLSEQTELVNVKHVIHIWYQCYDISQHLSSRRLSFPVGLFSIPHFKCYIVNNIRIQIREAHAHNALWICSADMRACSIEPGAWETAFTQIHQPTVPDPCFLY